MVRGRPGADPDLTPEAAEAAERESTDPEAWDLAAAELREGRYSDTLADQPGTVKRILGEGTRVVRWRRDHQGWSCRRCGSYARTLVFLGRHDRFHAWLDRVIAITGKYLDRVDVRLEGLENRLEDLGGELDRREADLEARQAHNEHVLEVRVSRAEARAEAAEAQVQTLVSLLGPILAKAYPAGPDQAEATITVEDRNAPDIEPVTAAD